MRRQHRFLGLEGIPLLAVQHLVGALEVDVFFPAGDGHSGDAVADQVSQCATDAHEPIHRQHQHQAHHRDRRNRRERRRQDHQRRPGNAVGAFGGDQRYQQDGQQVRHRQRRAGSIGDKHDGQGQVDGEPIEVERVPRRNHQAHGGAANAQMFEFTHDLWQHGVGGGGAHHDQQFFTQVLEQRQHAQARQAHHQAEDQPDEGKARQVKQSHQAAQVLQGIQAVGAGGKGNRAEHTDGREAHDHAHDAEDHMAQFVDQPRDTRGGFAHQVQRAAEQHREQQHLQHVVVGKGADHRVGDQVHQELAGAADVLALVGQFIEAGGRQLLQVDIGALADTGAEGHHQADHQGDGGQDFKVDHRLEADAPDFLQVARAGNAADHHAEHDQADQHLDQLDKAVTQGFELRGEFGKGHAADYAEHQANHDLQENRTRAPSEHGRDLYSVPWWFQGLIVVVLPVSPVRGQSTPGIFEITSNYLAVARSRSDQLVGEGDA